MKTNKLFVSLLALAVASLMLAGCTSESNDSSMADNSSSSSSVTDVSDSHSDNSSFSPSGSSGTSFTNAYGTADTKCAHSGCNNYIASSGDTNCCTTHSNKCLECGKYIDEDAVYCMSCLSKAAKSSAGKSSSSSSGSSSSKGTSSSKCKYKEGGVEICDSPATSDSNFCSYHKKQLDDAYNSLFGE